jgi:hypothetical protein
MDRKSYAIGVLTVTAVVLFIAQFLPVRPAMAADSVRDRDWQVVTARSTKGDESLYVTDGKTGTVAVFTWEPSERRIKLRSTRSVSDAVNP